MNQYFDGMRDVLARAGFRTRRSSNGLGGFAVGAGIGIVAGAALGLLFTPSNGRRLREQLGTHAKWLAQRTQGALRNRRHGETMGYRGRDEVPLG